MTNNKENIRRQRRRRRRIQRRRRLIALAVVIMTIIVIITSLIIGYIGKNDKENATDNASTQIEETPSSNDELPQEEEPSQVELTDEEKKQYVLENPDEYTEELINFMNKYDQVVDFVYHYKDREVANISETDVNKKTETAFPLYMQWDARWGYEDYGDSIIGIVGCGPTTLAMVYEGLTGNTDQTPITIGDMSERNGYCVEGGGTTWDLMAKGVNELGLQSQALPLYEGKLIEELENGRPIICNVGPGDFTQGGHFIVVTGYKDGKFMVNDPNSRENSSKLWEYSVLEPQIKNLWSFWK